MLYTKIIKRAVCIMITISCAVCLHTVCFAENVVERNKITDTVKVNDEDKYTITYYDKSYYDGSTLYTEGLEIKCGDKLLSNILNYSVETDAPNWRYEDNGDGRVIHAEIKGIGDYADLSYSFIYTFVPYQFTEDYELEIDRNIDHLFIYSGEEICPAVYVKCDKWNKQTNDYTLSDEYYKVSYQDNINAGSAKVVARGIGLYSGNLELSFEIKMYKLDSNKVVNYLRGESNVPVEELDSFDYSINVTDEDEGLAVILLSDRVRENYCFEAYSKADNISIKCSGLHIEKYMDQWAYDICPDGEIKQEDGSFIKVCETHTLILKKTAYDARCEVNGSTYVYKCRVCGRYFEDENGKQEIINLSDAVIPALGHTWRDWKMDVEPTDSYEGQLVSQCDRCGISRYKSLPKLDKSDDTGNSSYNQVTNPENSISNRTNESSQNVSAADSKTTDSSNESDDRVNAVSSDNKVSSSIPSVKKISGFKLASKKKKQLMLSWNKLKYIDGYEIQYGTDKTLKKHKSKKISKSKKSYTIKKLKSGSKYYVRIRGYKKYTDSKGRTKTQYGKWILKNRKCK